MFKFALWWSKHKFKANDSYIVAVPLFLGNIKKTFSADNIKKKWLNGYIYDFSIDYNAIIVIIY